MGIYFPLPFKHSKLFSKMGPPKGLASHWEVRGGLDPALAEGENLSSLNANTHLLNTAKCTHHKRSDFFI